MRDVAAISRSHQLDPVTSKLQESHTNAREAALATLDPKSAIERGMLPGQCDGQANQTVKFFSVFKRVFATVSDVPASTTGALQLRIAPFMTSMVASADAFDASGLPTATTAFADDMYAEALFSFNAVRCVAQAIEVRCLDNPLDLSGERTMCLAGDSLYSAGYTAILDRKDVYTIGNNKPGEVSYYPNISASETTFNPADFAWYSASPQYHGDCMHVAFQTDNVGDEFLLTVYTIWEAIPNENSLLTPTLFVGDPETYSAALSAALSEVPLNSHERISYEDDGVIASIASDVRTILGAGKSALRVAGNVKKAAGEALNFFDSFGSGIGSVVSGFGSLFATNRGPVVNPELKESDAVVAARLWAAIRSSTNKQTTVDAIRELLAGRTAQQVVDYLIETLQVNDPLSRARLRKKPPRARERPDWVSLQPPPLVRATRR